MNHSVKVTTLEYLFHSCINYATITPFLFIFIIPQSQSHATSTSMPEYYATVIYLARIPVERINVVEFIFHNFHQL